MDRGDTLPPHMALLVLAVTQYLTIDYSDRRSAVQPRLGVFMSVHHCRKLYKVRITLHNRAVCSQIQTKLET